jgi:hypothetical protein
MAEKAVLEAVDKGISHMILPRKDLWSKRELESLVDNRVFTVAQVARAVRQVGENLGLVGGDCYARNVPPVGDLLHENVVIHICLELPAEMLRHQRPLCQRLVRSYLFTATQVEVEHD